MLKLFIVNISTIIALIFGISIHACADEGFHFDNILSSMEGEPDFDDILAGMGSPTPSKTTKAPARESSDLINSVADVMSFGNTLTFLDSFFSGSTMSQYCNRTIGNGNGRYGLKPTYAYLVPGDAVLPIGGRVTSRYGYRPKFGRMHKGIDIALNVGDTVVSAIDGTVTRISNDPRGYGVFVCVRHDNGLETRYAHLSGTLCAPGQRVRAGQAIALGGSTGNSTGPHLHFETRVQGEAVDPSTMFDFTMPAGNNPYRTLGDLDSRNPKFIHPAAIPVGAGAEAKHTYVVRLGDTIASVARKHGMSELALCRLNMLSTTDALQPGRMLKLR